jgi:hypothetical protein
MTLTFPEKTFKKIKQGDDNFFMTDGIQMVARAGIEISQRCPDSYQSMIQECINHGWIKPVAYMKESEYIWEKLGD